LGAYLLKEANTLNKVPAKAKTAVGLGVGGVGTVSKCQQKLCFTYAYSSVYFSRRL
jgi:hypothetical protein